METTLELWASSLRDVKGRMRVLFAQERVAASATRQRNDLDAFVDETPGYGIAVRVGIDGAVRLHFAQLSKRCTA